TVIVVGPNNIAPKPTPVGWEHEPVTDGIFNADNTNTNPPTNPRSIFSSPCVFSLLASRLNLTIKNGRDKTPHINAQFNGKKPSIICIPWAILGVNNKTNNIHTLNNPFFTLSPHSYIYKKTPNPKRIRDNYTQISHLNKTSLPSEGYF